MGVPALLEFRGPDTVRFLNGQLTQDVRKIMGSGQTLPSCVTDAKGRLQFRVRITQGPGEVVWVEGPEGCAESLEARLTRYLIADDVEPTDLSGKFQLIHLLGDVPQAPEGVISRKSDRYGVEGSDWWLPTDGGDGHALPAGMALHCGDSDLECLRIALGVPAWGRELVEGMLPPEALLEATDISYQKGCYIGQEVISRIKSAGKVNRRLTRFGFAPHEKMTVGPLENGAGEITSVAPPDAGGEGHALGFLKRGVEAPFVRMVDGRAVPVSVR